MPGRRVLRVDHQLVARLGALGWLAHAVRGARGHRGRRREASGIENGASRGARLLGVVLVSEVPVDRPRAALVDVLAQVAEDAVALPHAQPLLKAAEELRPAGLV